MCRGRGRGEREFVAKAELLEGLVRLWVWCVWCVGVCVCDGGLVGGCRN